MTTRICCNCFKEIKDNGACPYCGYDPATGKEYPLALKQGTILNGRFIIGRVLGQGGFGITYLAEDDRSNGRVAIKEYFPTDFVGRTQGTYAIQLYSGDRKENFEFGKQQFLAEAKTLAAFIGDRHIVRVHSYFEENGTAYFTMDYVDGPQLDHYMKDHGGRLVVEEANRLLLPLMESLEQVHAKGIVHRDIAPDNIIIQNGDTAKLIDFGAARYSTGEKSKSLDVVLKHGFAPKEQYTRRGRQGPYTDVYAMTATYYYTITGKIPPDAIERTDIDELILPSTLGVKINNETEEAILKGLEVNALDRYQRMMELHDALAKAARADEAENRRREEEKKRREEEKRRQEEERARAEEARQREIKEAEEKRRAEEEDKEREKLLEKGQFEKDTKAGKDSTHGSADISGGEKKKTKRGGIALIAAASLAVGIGGFVLLQSSNESKPAPTSTVTTTVPRPVITPESTPAPTPESTPASTLEPAAVNVQDAAALDAEEMLNLGEQYEAGDGVEQDYTKAAEWYEKAAADGNADGMNRLGWLYCQGYGVEQDYAKAAEWYEKAAAAGNSSGMYNLGWLYEYGNGVEQDYAKAVELFEKAAADGISNGMVYLGMHYETGNGVEQDYIKAAEWYEKAAEAGNSVGMNNLGLLCENGSGVEQDYAKAAEWYEKAAAEGNSSGMNNLGWLYETGNGVEQDYTKAAEWYEKAAAAGNAVGMNNLGQLYEDGNGVEQDYTKAAEWYEKAAAEGNSSGMNNLGRLYENGNGVEQDYAKAVEWYVKAAAEGNSSGMNNLGRLYENGNGVEQDYAKAAEWYEKAATAGDASGMYNLGTLYEDGTGVEQDYTKAVEWYERAAEAGNASGMNNLGWLYRHGYGVELDYTKAAEWYQKAAVAGNSAGMVNLGQVYEAGDGVEQDYTKAAEWYEKAAAAGSSDGMVNLGWLYDQGHGVEQDYSKAVEWYEKATEAGNAFGMVFLGALYDQGHGVEQDYSKAREWYEKAAADGNAYGMAGLAALYERGHGVEQDYDKALEWYEKAAELGVEEAVQKAEELRERKAEPEKQDEPTEPEVEEIEPEKQDEPADQETETEQETTASIKIGDSYLFGRYEQDAEVFNEKEPIEWVVLDIQDGKALLISKFALSTNRYNTEYADTTWESSSLRNWLNNDFLKEAFSAEEQAAIVTTVVDNSANQGNSNWNTDGGNNTEDKVFLLSYSEAERYYETDEVRTCLPTAEAQTSGAETDSAGNCWWWLRSPGRSQGVAVTITPDGAYNRNYGVHSEGVAVRPALWIDLNAETPDQNTETSQPAETQVETISSEEAEELYQTGLMYYSGDGVEQDYATAAEYFKQAAEADNAAGNASKSFLGQMYQYGLGVTANLNKAIELYEEAAEKGDPAGMYALGYLYYSGYDNQVERDYGKAIVWFQNAAEHGDTNSMYWLGIMYENGEGVEQNYEIAMEWYLKAVEKGDKNSLYRIGLLYENGLGVEQDFSKAVKYYQDGADWGYSPQAMYYLAHMYEEGKGVEQDLSTALEWYHKAADEQGYYPAEEKASELEAKLAEQRQASDEDKAETSTESEVPEEITDSEPEPEAVTSETAETETLASEPEENSTYGDIRTVGSVVAFGQYYESPEIKSSIEWIVLDVQEGQSLLLSKNALDCVQYNRNYGPITWADSSIRRWLNNDFLNAAFSKEEQAYIVRTTVDNSRQQCNEEWAGAGGANTKDQVFLLSYAELKNLVGELQIKCQATPYAESRGTSVYEGGGKNNGNCWWWLRSPGIKGYNAAGVRHDGSIVDENTDYRAGAVRPAIWVDNSKFPFGDGVILQGNAVGDAAAVSTAGEALPGGVKTESAPRTTGIRLLSGDYHTPGTLVSFGSYEQDNDPENGSEDIEWIVLDRTEDNHLLLISSQALACRPFNIWGDPANITWGTSTLRTWLNDEFLEAAFSEEDQKAILLTQVDNSHYQSYGEYLHRDWANTEDRIFLLSYAEAWKYFNLDRERACRATGSTKSQGGYINKDNQNCGWWLRSPGEEYQDISYVTSLGEIGSTGINTSDLGNAVRPVLWLDLNALGISPEDKQRAVDTEFGAVGTTVVYGRYEQDNDAPGGNEEIEWIVLDADGDRRLLLSKYGLDARRFHEINVAVSWENSKLNSWLNGEFYETAFTDAEQKGILYTVVDNSEKQFYREIGNGNKSQDKLFLLSYKDVLHYLPSAESRICDSSAYAKAQNSNRAEKWWLRSPGRVLQFADYIDAKGNRNDEAVTGTNIIRPAMWVEIGAIKGEFTDEKTYSVKDFSSVGNVVKFGQYEQDNRGGNEKEDIEWIVLETDGESSLLISRCALDRRPFHEVNANLFWEESDIRTWLNNTFYTEAFDEKEQKSILVSNVNNGKEEWCYDVRPGKNTEDKVYLLSYREAWHYFRDDYERTCAGTAYANRDLDKELHLWWLRSPGKVYNFVNFVDDVGWQNDAWVCSEDYLVRPVIRIDLNSDLFRDT